jgi:hypothetical protein
VTKAIAQAREIAPASVGRGLEEHQGVLPLEEDAMLLIGSQMPDISKWLRAANRPGRAKNGELPIPRGGRVQIFFSRAQADRNTDRFEAAPAIVAGSRGR